MSTPPQSPVTRVYIDGFNLFYGSLKGEGLLWLGLGPLADHLAGGCVDRILYCTAMVRSGPEDPLKAVRQQLYLRAVKADPRVEVKLGEFRVRKTGRRLCTCQDAAEPCFVKVEHFEEKGSDVNLATHLVLDGCLGRYGRAIVVTGDSDLAEPIRVLVAERGLQVDVVNPRQRHSNELATVSSSYSRLGRGAVVASQMPDPVTLPGGSEVGKPPLWHTLGVAPPVCVDAEHAPCCCGSAPMRSRKFRQGE